MSILSLLKYYNKLPQSQINLMPQDKVLRHKEERVGATYFSGRSPAKYRGQKRA